MPLVTVLRGEAARAADAPAPGRFGVDGLSVERAVRRAVRAMKGIRLIGRGRGLARRPETSAVVRAHPPCSDGALAGSPCGRLARRRRGTCAALPPGPGAGRILPRRA